MFAGVHVPGGNMEGARLTDPKETKETGNAPSFVD